MAGPENGNYRRKIKTAAEIHEIIGKRPRAKSVIMCHGTFDVVHPGHIRHLMYARQKADLMIASLTCDAHIMKANFRPYVPEQLRAMNLAALEAVDYVVIDPNPTPIENIRLIQPDYFAKGYEYFKDGLHPKTAEEVAALEAYGGEVIFTPGDVVYSSSAFIEMEPPRIAAEKLITLLEAEGVAFGALREAISKFSSCRVHVVGDTIVDSYTYCTLIGGTAKTPTFSVKHEKQVDYSGGAAVVSKHVRRAGAQVRFSTVMGDDALKEFVLDDLRSAGIDCEAVVDHSRPTTQKNVFIAGGYRMLKVDKVDNHPISDKALGQLSKSLGSGGAQAFVFSDFRHGIFGRRTIPLLTQSLPKDGLRVADSQVANRWGNILDFEGFDLITPNEREVRFALGDQDSVVRPLGMALYRKARAKLMIMKLGERGVIAFRPHQDGDVRGFLAIDSFVGNLVDPVGAGDAMLAYSTLALAVSGSPVIASVLGSMAAAVACERDGNNPVAPEDVVKKLDAVEKVAHYK
ncbi:MAG: adenylyltransferase/cytidyltransferase family protein [Elusimicrobia bacterium]|nr:adenylyltransferase/cytidyltransferase family protein [Elusimicrobiota bacterium]